MSEMYERSARASREAWRNSGDAAPAPRVRDDAPTTDPDATVRLDATPDHCRRALDAARVRHAEYSRTAWRNAGDGVGGDK